VIQIEIGIAIEIDKYRQTEIKCNLVADPQKNDFDTDSDFDTE